MTDLECFVEDLFHAYRNAPGAGDLKAEILSNMQARQADLMSQGYSEAEAAQRAMDSAPDVGLLLKGRRPVYYVKHYRAACAQNALLASVLFWIASLPLMFLTFPELSYLGLVATLVTGGLYWYWRRHADDETAPRDHRQLRHTARLLWVCWGVFFPGDGGDVVCGDFWQQSVVWAAAAGDGALSIRPGAGPALSAAADHCFAHHLRHLPQTVAAV